MSELLVRELRRLAAKRMNYHPELTVEGQAAEEIESLRAEVRELRGALRELRIRYHANGRRPEECYEMSVIDCALSRKERGNE